MTDRKVTINNHYKLWNKVITNNNYRDLLFYLRLLFYIHIIYIY